VLAAPAAHGASSAAAANRATFFDERAEEPGLADVTSVVVSNDDGGRITFEMAIPGRPCSRRTCE
jgi:hypothetical protein